jgi:Fe-S cluster assembly protein SufB
MQDIQAFGDISRETLDRSDVVSYSAKTEVGLSESVIRQIWESNGEPDWMLDFRLKSLQKFRDLALPTW